MTMVKQLWKLPLILERWHMYPYRCEKDGTEFVLWVVLCPGQIQNPDGAMVLVLGACLMLPCLVPLVLRSIRTILETPVEKKTAVHVIMLWKYKPLNQDDAL
jgi:hypothetical protein